MISLDIPNYNTPFWLLNRHVHTIYASKFLSVNPAPYARERWNTPDGDFIDVDRIEKGNKRAVILGHGLEGSSRRPYTLSSARYFSNKDWDVVAWNSRSCSGEMNIKPKLYCHGDTADLDFVIKKISKENYREIVLIGFSMGGAIILNWLGRKGQNIPHPVKAAVAISAPCDIREASENLESGIQKLYGSYFLKKLKEKVKLKAQQFPGFLNTHGIEKIKKWREFDERFSAPLNGLASADEFYEYCSAKHRIDNIQIPTLLMNALDDPILSAEDYPENAISQNDYLYNYFPRKGGHVAFLKKPLEGPSFAELVPHSFIEKVLDIN